MKYKYHKINEVKLVFIHIVTFFLYAQNDDKEYHYQYNLYRINQEDVYVNNNKSLIDYLGINKVDTIDYELIIDNEKASFFANQKLSNEQSDGLNFTEIIIKAYGSWYYDLKNFLIYNTVDFENKKFSIEYDYHYIDWTHSQDVEIVNGYPCYHATYAKTEKSKNGDEKEYRVTVWYSDEVNPNAMPFGFVGLPGGVVKIDFNGFAEVILAQFNSKQNRKKKRNKSYDFGKIVTPSEFEKIKLTQTLKQKEYTTSIS